MSKGQRRRQIGPDNYAEIAHKILGFTRFTAHLIVKISAHSMPKCPMTARKDRDNQKARALMNLTLWIIAGLLAAVFLVAGANKLFIPKAKLAKAPGGGWVLDFSAGFVKVLGAVEILGAVGLILPALLNIAPILVPPSLRGAASLGNEPLGLDAARIIKRKRAAAGSYRSLEEEVGSRPASSVAFSVPRSLAVSERASIHQVRVSTA
jgi:DoxX-like family